MPPRSPSQVTREQLRSPADIRRAERALQKDLRFMIRENRRRRARNEKGPGGVKVADEFTELRQAQLAVSQRAAHLVRTEFPEKNAWLFRLRETARLALSAVPDWAARLVPRGAGPSNQSRHDEGRQNGPAAQGGGNAPVVNADQRGRAGDWVNAAEGKNQRRTAHTAAALSELMKAVPDLESWYRTAPGELNRTRDLFASAEQRHVERTNPQPMDLSSYQYTDQALLSQGPPGSPDLGPAPVAVQPGQNNWVQYPDQAEWSQATAPYQWSQQAAPAQWAQQAGPNQWAQQAGPNEWAQQGGPPQWAQQTAPVQWAQQNRPAPLSQVSPIEWSPGVGSVPSSPQVDQTPQFKVERKPLQTNNDQISRAASLTSHEPVNGRGVSATPPPMRQSTPKPRRAMS